MHVERAGKVLSWTWNEYKRDGYAFAKSLSKLNVRERSAIAIMGFNSPEWVIGFLGCQLYNCVATGIYSTNAADACLYQVDHSESEIILVENNELLKRFTVSLDKLPRVKAIIVWNESALPSDV
jgi:long-chain-fatty-acid--CoA ligase ACSBG